MSGLEVKLDWKAGGRSPGFRAANAKWSKMRWNGQMRREVVDCGDAAKRAAGAEKRADVPASKGNSLPSNIIRRRSTVRAEKRADVRVRLGRRRPARSRGRAARARRLCGRAAGGLRPGNTPSRNRSE